LSDAGRQEAHGLLTQLRDYPISQVLSSPTLRCLQTVEPLAQRRGLRVESAEAVLCSHGELIGAALIRLVGERLEGDTLRWPKGSTWVLKVTEGRIGDARYLPPLRLQDTDAGYY
jgi:broad specificity phosphatase PhoE